MNATLLLAPSDLLRFGVTREYVIENLDRYTKIENLEVPYAGHAGAEWLFDLTNNPSLQEERERVYGRGRSISVGDVVVINGEKILCDSFGWVSL